MLRGHRQAARLTLEQLAESSGVSVRTLSDVERGRSKGPQHRTVLALADALSLAAPDRQRLVDLARDGRLRDHWARPSGLCALPPAVADFTGRAAELTWIDDFARAAGSPGSAAAGLVTGSAGSGKTTLVIRAAHALRPAFGDGVLFLDLLGMSARPRPAADALGLLLGGLGVTDRQAPAGVRERASLYRSLLQERRILVVLDNAASEEQIRPLLAAGGASRVLVTSRRLLAGLEGVRRLVLGPLHMPEAAELLTGIVGERSATDGREALVRLAHLCGGLPLALRIIGNRLASRPDWSATELAARLSDEERRLAQFTAGDLKIANAFGMSYEQLGTAARRVFRRLAAVPGQDFDAALAAVAGAVELAAAWDALDELVDLGLLQDVALGRYRFHDLVRLFARDRLRAEETEAERAALTARVRSWLLRMATTAGRWFEPAFGPPDRPDADLAVLSGAQDAERWLRANLENWLGALRQADACGEHAAVLDCAEAMHWFSDRWVHAPHWREVFTLGACAAAALGDPVQQATQVNYLAWVHGIPLNDPEGALRHATRALSIATRSDATAQIAWAHNYTAIALRRLDRFDEAVDAATRAADLFESLGDADAHMACVSSIGHCLREAGRPAEAVERYREALALADDEDSGVTPGIAAYLRPHYLADLGACLGRLGIRDEAIAALTEATALMEAYDANYLHGRALEALAALLAQEGRTRDSRRTYGRAADAYESVGDVEALRRCRRLATGVG
ncbi:tetratricopeptide repeat protein [Streptomyces sp. WMMC500]|uniref:ATP-binding protein n=1 Tax=Streptomyces sp. WMMC500 TaxID=3015154 RepID=UPI00248CD0F3|nr:tetratricopeptide repeat protein [Streptomyces sp. WMMC500]WBB61768.1 tetratricopeptide repeat protein [Streptomyces sp. WMMC500]